MTKIFKWIILASVIGSLITLGVGIHLTQKYIRMNRDVSIEYSLSDNVSRGLPFNLNIKIENKGTAPLKNAELTLKLGKDIINPRALTPSELSSEFMHLGDITSNSFGTASTTLLAVKASNENAQITASLKYTNQSGTKYETEQKIPVIVTEHSPIKLLITAPNEIISGSFADIDVSYENTTETNFPNVRLNISYPSIFKYVSSNLPPEENKNIWNLGEIQKNGRGNIRVRGLIENQNREPLNIKASVNLNIAGKDFEVGAETLNTETTRTPIEIEIPNITNTVEAGGEMNITTLIKNMSGASLSNTIAKISLSGAFYPNSLETNGKPINGSTTIIWDSTNSEDLLNWNSGTSKELSLKIKAKDPSDLLLLNDRNRTIKLTVEVTSETVPSYIKASQTKGIKTHEIQVVSGLKIDASAFFHDSEYPALNSGPMPIKVGQTTDFTIHWTLKNFGEPLESLTIRSILPESVKWKNNIKTSTGSGPKYDESTREIIWQISTLPGEEISGQTKAVFQVSLTPETRQIGSYLPLLEKTTASAINSLTKESVGGEDARLTTELTDDPSVGKNDGKVIP